MGEVDDKSLKEEPDMYKQFLRVSEMEYERHEVFKIVMNTLDLKHLLQKLDVVLDSLKRTAKLNVAFGFCAPKRRRREL